MFENSSFLNFPAQNLNFSNTVGPYAVGTSRKLLKTILKFRFRSLSLFLIWFKWPETKIGVMRPNRSGFIHSVNLTSYEWRSKQRKREGEIKEREKMGQNFKVEIATRKRQKILLWLSWMLRLECSIQVSGMLILGSNFSTPPCKLMLREVFFIWWQVWSEKIQFFFNV